MIVLASLALALAILPALMTIKNLSDFRDPTKNREAAFRDDAMAVSVIIPARNEESSIGECLETILESTHRLLEVIVVDDHSEDGTGKVVDQIAARDSRVRRQRSAPLPEGWNGKQHACWQGSQEAQFDCLLFLDADVRLTPNAIRHCIQETLDSDAKLVSGFPYQETESFAEKLLIPMMHVVLLGYLPLERMRGSTDPAFAAGCGQLFMADRTTYMQVDGHRAIRGSRHDGIQLPRVFRRHGYKTDVFDASQIARVRMYRSWSEVMRGLQKNATEGIANRKLIVIFTVLLGGAAVLPSMVVFCAIWSGSWIAMTIGLVGVVLSFLPRALCSLRFRQSWLGVILHPIAVVWFLGLQWKAFASSLVGKKIAWRGRY